jgi:3-oxoacyl-[acyl-carrier protein] reductase
MSGVRPVVLITGAGRGIGRGIAVRLAGAGYSVAINFRADAASAGETAEACERTRTHPDQIFLPLQADISHGPDRERLLAETLSRAGRIDALVNNAGIAPRVRADLLETTPESFDEVLAANLTAPFFLSQLVSNHWLASPTPPLLPGGCAIVFISSVSAEMVSVNRPQYCIAKAGLSMASKLFAHRLAPHGISIYELRPGIIATDMTAPVKEKYDGFIAGGGVPQRRWGTPDDVALAVESLLDGRFPYSTGAVIAIDGGLGIHSL